MPRPHAWVDRGPLRRAERGGDVVDHEGLFQWQGRGMRVFYDIGANNGDDIPCDLLRSERVVAVEANPSLATDIETRFSAEIDAGRLFVEKVVVTSTATQSAVPFFIHRPNHVLSSMFRPPHDQMDQYEEIPLPSKNVMSIIQKFGMPHYIKIDVEGSDLAILRSIFSHGIFPPYLSAELANVEIFCALVAQGRYPSFKLVDGPSVPDQYGCRSIATLDGPVEHRFPFHSAGPFGNDIDGPWERAGTFFQTLARLGTGWKDIHVSNVDLPER